MLRLFKRGVKVIYNFSPQEIFLFSFIFIFDHSLISIWLTDIYIIVWVIIQYYFTLLLCFIPQIVPALATGDFWACSCGPWTPPMTGRCFICSICLHSETTCCSGLILHISCSRPRISHFFKELWLLTLKIGLGAWYFKLKIWF